ncbi:glutamine-hydrolyzing GMP synthase [Candidatus Bathyarchaeota archaeon]|nr:glutamine-hydrolyzing GMP synthase [Candidatus Bathyarchaeota archaeon]
MISPSLPDSILIFDFGGQYCHLIARRIRELHVYSEILPYNSSLEDIYSLKKSMNIKGIILSGSPASVKSDSALIIDKRILELNVPILGLCYGHQLLANIFGGDVSKGIIREYGLKIVKIDEKIGVLEGLNDVEKVWMSHGDTVYRLPKSLRAIAHTDTTPIASFIHNKKPIFGLQWHPEVVHTENGLKMLRNFIFNICKCDVNWRPSDFFENTIMDIRKQVGDKKAIIALSGGIDSSVAAALAGRALGNKIAMIHVDHGLMRFNESNQVKEAMEKINYKINVVNARQRFLERLKGVYDPEEKRKIIGEEFIRVFEHEAKLFGAEYLIQGTIYPDRIESGITQNADTIKTHHNVGGLPSKIDFKGIIEPLKDLYKDEVRAIGKIIGLPNELIWRQPFPGPGLAVRIIGEVTKEKLEILRKADVIVCEEVENSSMNVKPWQYFTVLTNTRSTGVKGDERAYGWTIAIRIVESVDAMTANFMKVPWELIEKISIRITNSIPEITRVVYDVTNKPPATIEWE